MTDVSTELRVPRLRTLDAFRRARTLLAHRRAQVDAATHIGDVVLMFHRLADDVEELLDIAESTTKEDSHAESI